MALVRPFRALRYNTHDPLSLALVTAPPYDCIGERQREELYRTHPHNIVRLILPREAPGDDEVTNKFTRAADLLERWTRAGVLVRDPLPALYLYQQEFRVEGVAYLREGLLARVGLEEFGSGRIFPHEETMRTVREERLRLLRAVRAHLSPVFAVYPDPENLVPRLFHEVVHGEPIVQTVDADGVVHRLFGSTDPGLAERVAEVMAEVPLYIADGHHRYEVALAYRRELLEAGHPVDEDHPAAYLLMLCVSMHHPGLVVLPTHRVLCGLEGLECERLREATAEHFEWRTFGGAEATSPRMVERLREAPPHSFALWLRGVSEGHLLTLRDPAVMDRLAADRSPAWRRLDVAILERVFIDRCLGRAVRSLKGLRRRYVHPAQEAFDAVFERGADAAVLLRPLAVEALEAVAAAGERMPPKSTYFYPKPLSGLVINPLD